MTSNTTVLFALLCGWKNAHRYALTGDHFDAQEARGSARSTRWCRPTNCWSAPANSRCGWRRCRPNRSGLNKAITTYGLDAMGLSAALNMNGVLSSIVEAENDGPDVEHLDQAQAEGGFGAFLKARDDPFRPEPFGPRSKKRD